MDIPIYPVSKYEINEKTFVFFFLSSLDVVSRLCHSIVEVLAAARAPNKNNCIKLQKTNQSFFFFIVCRCCCCCCVLEIECSSHFKWNDIRAHDAANAKKKYVSISLEPTIQCYRLNTNEYSFGSKRVVWFMFGLQRYSICRHIKLLWFARKFYLYINVDTKKMHPRSNCMTEQAYGWCIRHGTLAKAMRIPELMVSDGALSFEAVMRLYM